MIRALLLFLSVFRPCEQLGAVLVHRQFERERTKAFHGAFHFEEHPADVRVLDDRNARSRRIFPMRDARALLAVTRIVERVEKCARCHGDSLHADGDACSVHHFEHLRHALVESLVAADGPADALPLVAEVQDAGARTVDAHLVLERADRDVVAFAERTVCGDATLRNDEQRQAFGAGRSSFHPREDEVDDVLGEVMVSARDEDLRAADRVAAVGIARGTRLRGPHVRSRMRFGEAHRRHRTCR